MLSFYCDPCVDAKSRIALLRLRIARCSHLVYIAHFFCLRGCVAISFEFFIRSVEHFLITCDDCSLGDPTMLAGYLQNAKGEVENRTLTATEMLSLVMLGKGMVDELCQGGLSCRTLFKIGFKAGAKRALIVVTVLFVLVSIFVWFGSIDEHLKIARAKIQLEEMKVAFIKVKSEYALPLSFYSGTDCSVCPCRSGDDVTKLPYGETCRRQWREISTKVLALAGWDVDKIAKYYTDPWGSPYGLNEGDQVGSCREDLLISAGPPGRFGTPEQITISLPSYFCRD